MAKLAPSATGWTGRSGLTPYTVDIAALVAALPSYDDTGHTKPTYSAIMAAIDKFAPVFGMLGSYAPLGYRGMFPQGMGAADDLYGEYIAQNINSALLALIADSFLTSEKEAIATRIVSHGIQWYDSWLASGEDNLQVNGGHWQWSFQCAALALAWTGRTSELAALRTKFGGSFDQAFYIDATRAAQFVPHDSMTGPFTWRRRNLDAISGTNYTVETRRSDTLGDNPKFSVTGLILTNGTARTEVVTGAGSDAPATDPGQLTITVADATGFSVDDAVWFEPSCAPVEGQYEWTNGGGAGGSFDKITWFNPLPGAQYRQLNKWSPVVLFLKAANIWHSEWDPVAGYVDAAARGNYPAIGFDHPTPHSSTWAQQFWDDYAATIVGQTQIPAQMDAPTVTETDSTTISVALAADVGDGGSAITGHDLRWRTDGGAWTVVSDISDPEEVTSLAVGGSHEVQTRAKNTNGAGPWSVSAVPEVSAPSYTQQRVYTNGTLSLSRSSGVGGNENALTLSLWLNVRSTTVTQFLFDVSGRSSIYIASDGRFSVVLKDTSNITCYNAQSDVDLFTIGTWQHIYVSADFVSDNLVIELDGLPISMSFATSTFDGGSGAVDFDRGTNLLLSADMYVADFMLFNRVVANSLLYNGGVPPNPADFVTPNVLISGNAAVWNAGTNSGSGGAITVNSPSFTDV